MNPNPERDRRVRQIREQLAEALRPQRYPPRAGWEDIEFLLSLLDSQAPVSKSAHDLAVEWSESTEEGSIISTADIDRLAIVITDAATRMRDRCVQKVNELTEPERRKLQFGTGATGQRCRDRIRFSNEIIAALQSLTLEGEQEKQ